MAKLPILRFPDPRLRKKGLPVKAVTPDLQVLADDMLETMYAENGIGLAAAQVDRQIRLIVVDTAQRSRTQTTADEDQHEAPRQMTGDDTDYDLNHDEIDVEAVRDEFGGETDLERAITQPLILFNPVVVKKQGKTTFNEGCLSVPTYYEVVERAKLIEVEALDREGRPVRLITDGLLAICIQHEIDHLDGKLFIDRLSPIKSARVKSKIKKNGYPDKTSAEKSSKKSSDEPAL
jgi:peptide deformylase